MAQRAQLPTMDLYDILGVPCEASQEYIKKAFKRLSLSCHPDKAGGSSKVHDKYVKIVEAYKVLGDADKRQQYNAEWLFARLQVEDELTSSSKQSSSSQRPRPNATKKPPPQHSKPSPSQQSRPPRPKEPPQTPISSKRSDDDKTDKDKKRENIELFFSFWEGGYEAFKVEFERRKQQRREEDESTEQSAAAAVKKTPSEEEKKKRFPPVLIIAYLDRQLDPLEDEIELLFTELVTITHRLRRFIAIAKGGSDTMSPVGIAFSEARRRLRRLHQARQDIEAELDRLRAATREKPPCKYLGLAHGADRLLARVACARRAIGGTNVGSYGVLGASPGERDKLLHDLRDGLMDWLQRSEREEGDGDGDGDGGGEGE